MDSIQYCDKIEFFATEEQGQRYTNIVIEGTRNLSSIAADTLST